MDKTKIYELAKELNIENKELLAQAQKLGIKATSHLSAITESEVDKIKESMNKKKSNKKDEIKTTGQVIIRREVIVEEDEKKNSRPVKDNRTGIGFDERRNKNYNIVYREKPAKPMTVNELFGIKPKETPKKAENTIKKEEVPENKSIKNEIEDTKKDNELQNNKVEIEKSIESNAQKTVDNISQNNYQDNQHNDNRKQDNNFNRNNRDNRDYRDNSFNKDRFNNRDNNFNRNNQNRNDRFNNGDNNSYENHAQNNFNRNNNQNGFNRSQNGSGNGFNRNNNSNGFVRNNNQNGFNRNQNGSGNSFNRNNNSNGFVRNNNQNGFNRNQNGNGFNRNNNSNGFNRNGNSNGFNRNNNGNGFNKDFRRPSNGRSLEKDISDIVSTEFLEKDNQRDYSTKIIDKQKANRNFEDKKKVTKARKGPEEDTFDEDKLRNLKTVDRLSNMFEDQEGGMLDYYDLTTERGKKNKKKTRKNEERIKQKIFELKTIVIPENISVKDLATELKKTSTEIIKKLFDLGIMASINQNLDFDTAYLVADNFGVTATKKEIVKDEDILFDDTEDKEEDLQERPPVVVVMGHVDHGKTSLLDAIRKTNVIEGEAGGITQHIGAYKVTIKNREITFLDTPGHEAFTSMRARGAQITDIAILVVAADDGVMPQTIEAINHAKAAGIPIIVAVNKIDLPGANVDKVKQELMKYELVPEEWGGDTIFVPISAKNNVNIDTLLEMVLLVADMKELRANPNRQSKGTVIEARLDKAQGPIASVLVQRGTLNVGDTIILGTSIGKIRTMKNDKGKNIKAAGPSTPVEITGLSAVPEAGDTFYEVKNEKVAKHLIEKRKLENREKTIENFDSVTLDNLFEKMESEELKQLSIIVKTDVQGTAEAMKSSLEKLSNNEVRVKVIHSSAGGVTESDVELAKAAKAIVIAFNVRPVGAAKKLAEKEGVEIKQYSIIYQALEDVQDAMKGMLAPVYKEVNIGNAEVIQIFKVSNVGTIAGCFVTDGKLERNAGVRVIRDSVVIHDGKLISLKRFKDDAKEVSKGFECGLQIEDFDDLKEGDTIEAYIKEEVKR